MALTIHLGQTVAELLQPLAQRPEAGQPDRAEAAEATLTRWATTRAELVADGYQPGAPSDETARRDAEVVSASPCLWCGAGPGLRYAPYVRGSSYRAFAHCGRCDFAQEF